MEGTSGAAINQRRLVFKVADQCYEIDAKLVFEVVRVPHITRVPHGPEALAGIANLRGKPVPVLSMGKILTGDMNVPRHGGKIIIYRRHGAIGLLVDEVLHLSTDGTATLLQGLDDRLDAAFKVVGRPSPERTPSFAADTAKRSVASLITLLSFRVAGQLYGLPLEHIREVAKWTSDVTTLPDAADGVMGLVVMRGRFLSLVSLASLLGLIEEETEASGRPIIVVEHGGDLIGLVVDEFDAIHRLSERNVESVPGVLQRGRGEAQIAAIGRVDEGELLISILSPDKLYAHHAVRRALDQTLEVSEMETIAEPKNEKIEQFLIFQLDDESYGLPIGAVDEVVRVPEEITRIPGAPAYVMGVINLRGKAMPLIDQRSRFDAPFAGDTKRVRAIILTLGKLQAGFVVDGVTEVKSMSTNALSEAPEFSSEQSAVFDRIAHIEAEGRMILLVDPKELLSRAERDTVAALTRETTVVADK